MNFFNEVLFKRGLHLVYTYIEWGAPIMLYCELSLIRYQKIKITLF